MFDLEFPRLCFFSSPAPEGGCVAGPGGRGLSSETGMGPSGQINVLILRNLCYIQFAEPFQCYSWWEDFPFPRHFSDNHRFHSQKNCFCFHSKQLQGISEDNLMLDVKMLDLDIYITKDNYIYLSTDLGTKMITFIQEDWPSLHVVSWKPPLRFQSSELNKLQ